MAISVRGGSIVLGLAVLAGGCATSQGARAESRKLSRAVARGDQEGVNQLVLPATAGGIDEATLFEGGRGGVWAKVLASRARVERTALIVVADGQVVEARETKDGWRFAQDPTDHYSQATPRQALSALVLASRQGRYDVLIHLAPRRYRIGLSREDLEKAWTEGEHGAALSQARDRVAAHLADPIVADDHEAVLDLGGGHKARLEREGAAWVVVDF